MTRLWCAVSTFGEPNTGRGCRRRACVGAAFGGPLDHPTLIGPAVVMLAGYVLLANPGWNIDTLMAAFRQASSLMAVRVQDGAGFSLLRILVASPYLHSVWGLVVALVGSYTTALVHRLFLARRFLCVIPLAEVRSAGSELREILAFGVRVAPGALASGASSVGGTWILGATTSLPALGGWSRATRTSAKGSTI